MTMPITRQELDDQRRGLVGWCIGLFLVAMLIALSWTAIKGASGIDKVAEDYPDAVKELFGLTDPLTSPSGYLNSQLFAYFLPVLMLVFAVGRGARLVAGDEEDGRMELLSSLPVSRSRLVLEKATTIVLALIPLVLTTFITLAALAPAVGLHVGTVGLAAACVGAGLVGAVGGSLALAVGAATGRRGIAVAVPSAYVALTYVLQGLAPTVHGLSWTKLLSPMYWSQHGNPVANGFSGPAVGVLVAAGAVLVAGAVRGFARRDLRA